ncbi:cell division protein FtsK [Actinomadura bangladeshensis]|uniref:Cell division protein FtsK n=1 Tax=Actinomadura bangladeshensis TaxID=453573 RepID=A0A6L9QC75_9ACTN|nr:cell division protein FtsK [Actinomadura bangladeshensis]NEA22626.1 cell division protein FtsK [Actinomadura bangladeshensis]
MTVPHDDDQPPVRLIKATRPDEPGTDLDTVDEQVLEGTVLDGPPGPVETVRAAVAEVVHHPRARTAGRQVLYVAGGATILAKRLWDSRTTARYERMMRAAEASGDLEATLEWEARAAAFRKDRHDRRMDLLELPIRVFSALPKVTAGAVALLVGIGILLAIADHDTHKIAVPILVIAKIVQFVGIAVSVAWGPLLLAAPWIVVAALWHLGRNQAANIAWIATTDDSDIDLAIDETTIARALEALRIPQITAHFKQGLLLQYLTTARRDGRGTHAIVRLPAGVTAERIARRRADLATGLHRLAKEVWPTTGSEAGILDLWVADKGVLAEGAGPYPLLTEGFTDVFKGVPVGRTLRGDPIPAPIMERNSIVGGMPGQGKSALARDLMAGAALDPTAELRIWVPDANYDFEVYRRRCSRYVMGADHNDIEQIRDDLRELYEEVQTRGDLLVEHKIPAVTREIASQGVGLHPLLCLLEEAHVAINHAEFGEEISWLLVEITRLGRKRGIHLIVSTQAPTKNSIPRDVTRNCTNGFAFAVGDHVANDALLGQGAYAGGHRATELIPGVDRGTCVAKGITGERSDIIQAYYLDVSETNDQVTPLIDRVLAELERRGRVVPGTDIPRGTEKPRDLLDDLDEVLGIDRVRLADVPALLRELAPDWPPYKTLTGVALRGRLKAHGVRVTNSGNVLRLDPLDLRKVVADRSTADLDEEGE